MTQPEEHILYRIDKLDLIEFIEGAWDAFTIANGAPQLVSVDMVGRSIWDSISNETIRHIYKQIIDRARAGETIQVDFRCDSPELRRYLQMRISPCGEGSVQFETRTIRIEDIAKPADPPNLKGFAGNLLVTCSWCQKYKTGENAWHDVADAIRILDLFELVPIPHLSHGMCAECFESVLKRIPNR